MIDIQDIIKVLEIYNKNAISDVLKAYQIAEDAHRGVVRESGEPYITHPLHVTMNLLDMEVFDKDTLCAALLHDVVEDTEVTLEDISTSLNPTISELVDGVTKMRRMNFSTKEEQELANSRKIINGLTKDVRIILIKLADRLHNMRTLEFKKPHKQRENAIETMEIFVPLALSIGAYQIKSELEDLALLYIEPDTYHRIEEKREELGKVEREYLEEVKGKLQVLLQQKDISADIIIRMKNICNIYRKIIKGYEIENIYDLFYLKILVDEVEDCYRSLSCIHRLTPPINGRFKDYIYNPRTNHYQSLHTTVSDMNGKLIKEKVRTYDMDKVSAFGISAYWNLAPSYLDDGLPHYRSVEATQKAIRERLQFAKKLREIDSSFTENRDFMKEIKEELLTEHVYVYTHSGEIIELPFGSTALDFACQVYPELLDIMTGVIVNGKQVSVSQVLENNDTVQIDIKGFADRRNWENSVRTHSGREKVRLLTNRQNSRYPL